MYAPGARLLPERKQPSSLARPRPPFPILVWAGGVVWRSSLCNIDVDCYEYESESNGDCYALRCELAPVLEIAQIACGTYDNNRIC